MISKQIFRELRSGIVFSLAVAAMNLIFVYFYNKYLLEDVIEIVLFLTTLFLSVQLLGIIIANKWPSQVTGVIIGKVIVKMIVAFVFVIAIVLEEGENRDENAIIFVSNYFLHLGNSVYSSISEK